jgi:hypothetical protein
MTGASEWRRAAIAVTGVTLVLLIAASIHFLVPARPRQTPIAHSIATLPEPAPIIALPMRSLPTLRDASSEAAFAKAAADPQIPAPPRALRLPPPRHVTPGLQDIVAEGTLNQEIGTPALAEPLVARLEIPEDRLHVEPMRLPVSAEFAEPSLSVARERADESDGAVARAARQRDPVTAAFVTAGSAVAGGFRSAGRAIKRAF